MLDPDVDTRPARGGADSGRCGARDDAAGAELTCVVAAPAVERASGQPAAGVLPAGDDAAPLGRRADLAELAPVVEVTDSQPPVAVVAPAVRGAALGLRTGVERARADAGPAGGRADAFRRRVGQQVADAELTVAVVAPAVERAGALPSARMGRTRADAGPSCGGADAFRLVPVGAVTGPELGVEVRTPAVEGVVGGDRAGEVTSGADRQPLRGAGGRGCGTSSGPASRRQAGQVRREALREHGRPSVDAGRNPDHGNATEERSR